jgi:hypothetical protein
MMNIMMKIIKWRKSMRKKEKKKKRRRSTVKKIRSMSTNKNAILDRSLDGMLRKSLPKASIREG